MRQMWQKSTDRWKHRWQNNHVLACQISVCWSLYFNWTALHLQVQLTIYIFNSDLRKIRLVLHLLKCDHCIHRGVSVHAVLQIYPIFTAVTVGFRYLWFLILLHMHIKNWCSTLEDPHLLGTRVFNIQKCFSAFQTILAWQFCVIFYTLIFYI